MEKFKFPVYIETVKHAIKFYMNIVLYLRNLSGDACKGKFELGEVRTSPEKYRENANASTKLHNILKEFHE